MATNTDSAEKKCSFCARTFQRPEHLARHLRAHTGEKPFGCNVCRRSFSRHDTLLRHKRRYCPEGITPSDASPSSALEYSNNDDPVASDVLAASPTAHPHVNAIRRSRGPMNTSASRSMCINNLVSDQSSVDSVNLDQVRAPVQALSQAWGYQTPASNMQHLNRTEEIPALHETPITHSAEAFLNSPDYASQDFDMWNISYDPAWTSWSVGSEFDLDAVNASIADTINQQHGSIYASDQNILIDTVVSSLPKPVVPQTLTENIERNWCSYTRYESDITPGTVTPAMEIDNTDKQDVDEAYRYNLASRLQQRPYDNSLPSTEFLNLSVRLYFARFHPIFPIVHAPTFRPSMAKSLLLLSICSIGSLFMGSSVAKIQGVKIFETLNKCIVNSWDRYLARSGLESLGMLQASLLGQTFAILSGLPKRLGLAQAYHGSIVAWARQTRMFKEQPEDIVEASTSGGSAQLDKAWRSWAQSQQRIRLVLGLQIHDAELAIMFHHKPLLCHEKESLRRSTSEQLFNATSAKSWYSLAKRGLTINENQAPSLVSEPQVSVKLSAFDGYAWLDGIAAAICESRQQDILGAAKQSLFISELLRWQHEAKDLWKDQFPDPLCLTVLWHSTFIALLVDCEQMECAIGKDGLAGVGQAESYIIEWASSPAACRAMKHAFCLQRRAELIQYGREPALHVPRCLFQAGCVWYLYGKHAPSGSDLPNEGFPEFHQIGTTVPQNICQRARKRSEGDTTPDLSTLYTLKDLLQRLGRWGLGKKYASVLGLLLEGDSNDGD